jgi:cation transport regulator ChaC
MTNCVYDPKWLACRTPQGNVTALAFTLSRESPNYTGQMDDAHVVQILRRATGATAPRWPTCWKRHAHCARTAFATRRSSAW